MHIRTSKDIEDGLRHLTEVDPVLKNAASICDQVPIRNGKPGFEGIASIVVSQQVSKASADAIFSRLGAAVDPLTPENFLDVGETVWREVGLSRPKQRTLREVANAVCCGSIIFERLPGLAPEEAISELTAIKGIGPWTAEVYLMFSIGHRDIFPAGDLALQEAIRLLHQLDDRPPEKECRRIADKWSPFRSVAARLLWSYYGTVRRDAMPAA